MNDAAKPTSTPGSPVAGAPVATAVQFVLDTIRERTYRQPETYVAYRLSDGELNLLVAALEDAEAHSNFPVQVKVGRDDGQDWLLAMGRVDRDAQCEGGEQRGDVFITTDRVHCSEVRGDALCDAEAYVTLRNNLPGIIASLEELLRIRVNRL